jgi:hypothetical protein
MPDFSQQQLKTVMTAYLLGTSHFDEDLPQLDALGQLFCMDSAATRTVSLPVGYINIRFQHHIVLIEVMREVDIPIPVNG